MRPSFQCPKIECMNKSVPRETKPNKRWHFWMNSRKKRAMEITLIQNRDRKKCSMEKKICSRAIDDSKINGSDQKETIGHSFLHVDLYGLDTIQRSPKDLDD